jgi:protease IV
MRPMTRGFLIGGAALLVFYLVIVGVAYLFFDQGIYVGGSAVGVVEVRGMIAESRSVLERLREFRDDSGISAIILRIDSPGGAVGPTQEIYTEVRRTRQFKPVIASLGGTCASGAYYVAAACTRIVANPGTLTGSIGVIMEFFNVEGLFEWVGLRSTVVKSGQFKDMGSYARTMEPKEAKLLQEVVDNVHVQFVQAVSEGRNLPIEQVAEIADGRIFTGEQAQALSLVDDLGNFHDAVDIAAQEAGLSGTPDVVWPKKRKMSYMDLLFDNIETRISQALDASLRETPLLNYR